MKTPGERLQSARQKAGFRSTRSAAIENEWPYSTYYAHEQDTRGLDEESARRYGRRFAVSWLWLLHGDAAPQKNNTITVQGLISAGGRIETSAEGLGSEGLNEIEVPFALPEGAQAFRVSGDSMFPRYDDGDVIIVLDKYYSRDELINFEAVVTTSDGDRYLKRMVQGVRKNLIDLESFNAPTMKNIKVARAAPVHTVVRKGQWAAMNNAAKRKTLVKLITKPTV